MKRLLGTVALAWGMTTAVGADVTITTTTSLEGGMAAMAGGAVSPTMTTRIKGSKSRTDVEMGPNSMATLLDLATKQAIILNPGQKTAQYLDAGSVPAVPEGMKMPTIETSLKPTGQTRDLDGSRCQEYAVAMKMDMSGMAGGGGKMPAEAAAALKDLRMNMTGSVCVATDGPAAAEYAAFQAGAAQFAVGALTGGGSRGMPPGMEQLVTGFKQAPGIPLLTELTMAIEGSGDIANMMRQMGEMKITSRVKSVSTEALPDTLFVVPADFKVVKP